MVQVLLKELPPGEVGRPPVAHLPGNQVGIDTWHPEQQAKLEKATHFNPVDIACATKNYQGEPFDLTRYQDPDTGFISEKSKDGQPLKALEHPGLWNGSMAYWNTLFVEVPVITFNPVKRVNDLLRSPHQPGD